MNIWSSLRIGVALAAVSLLPAVASAQQSCPPGSIHAGDIAPCLITSSDPAFSQQIAVGGGGEQIEAATGYKFWTGDFGDFTFGAYETHNPGFNTNAGSGFQGGSLLAFTGLETLSYWDGTSWSSAVPGGVTVTVEDVLGVPTIFSATGVANPTGFVGQFAANGSEHDHLPFIVTTGAAVGAYSITLQLFSQASTSDSTPLYAASDPFRLVFNRGLSAADFNAAIHSLTAPVPLPAAAWLLISGLMGMGVVVRRRDSVATTPALAA